MFLCARQSAALAAGPTLAQQKAKKLQLLRPSTAHWHAQPSALQHARVQPGAHCRAGSSRQRRQAVPPVQRTQPLRWCAWRAPPARPPQQSPQSPTGPTRALPPAAPHAARAQGRAPVLSAPLAAAGPVPSALHTHARPPQPAAHSPAPRPPLQKCKRGSSRVAPAAQAPCHQKQTPRWPGLAPEYLRPARKTSTHQCMKQMD